MNNFVIFFNSEYTSSMMIYLAIIVSTSFFAFISQKVTEKEDGKLIYKTSKVYFIISFIIAGTFAFFIKSGVDFVNYVKIYELNTIQKLSDFGVEPGFRILNLALKLIIPDAEIGVSFIKLITVCVMFRALYVLKDKINLGLAVLAYMTLFYLQSFDLIRIYLAGAILFYGYAKFMVNKKYLPYALRIILATTIHYTALFGFLLMFIEFLCNWRKEQQNVVSKNRILLISIMIVIITIIMPYLFKFLAKNIIVFDKYLKYFNEGTIGIGQFIYYSIPILIAIIYKKYSLNDVSNDMFLMTILAFCMAILGYVLGITTRMFIYYSIPFMVMIPTFYASISFKEMKEEYLTSKYFHKEIYLVIFIIYYIFRFILNAESNAIVEGMGNIIWLF